MILHAGVSRCTKHRLAARLMSVYRAVLMATALAAHQLSTRGQDWQAISGGGQWDAEVLRGTPEECGVGDVVALSSIPCGCSCGDPPNDPGCEEDSDGMYARTGYTCEQIAGSAENACVTAAVPACAGANATQASCESAGTCTFIPASGDTAAACTTTEVPDCALANSDRNSCETAGACIFLTGNPDYLHCNQLVRDITAEEAYTMWTSGIIDLIIDVRSPTEYASAGDPNSHDPCGHGFSDEWDGCEIGHIPGAYLVPLNPWNTTQLQSCSTDSDKPVTEMTVATTCYNHASHPDSAWRSNTGAALLEQAGFKCVYNIVDGTKGWKERGFPVTLDEPWPAAPPACSGPPYYQAGVEWIASSAANTAAAGETSGSPAQSPDVATSSAGSAARRADGLLRSIAVLAMLSAVVPR